MYAWVMTYKQEVCCRTFVSFCVCRYMEASLALAALHVGGGDSAAAEAVLAALDGAVAAHQLTLPEGQLQQVGLRGVSWMLQQLFICFLFVFINS